MEQLKIGDIMQFVKELQKQGMTLGEIYDIPVYIGDDDELNGIHTAWYTNLVDPSNTEDADFVELINDSGCNIEIKCKALLIS